MGEISMSGEHQEKYIDEKLYWADYYLLDLVVDIDITLSMEISMGSGMSH